MSDEYDYKKGDEMIETFDAEKGQGDIENDCEHYDELKIKIIQKIDIRNTTGLCDKTKLCHRLKKSKTGLLLNGQIEI